MFSHNCIDNNPFTQLRMNSNEQYLIQSMAELALIYSFGVRLVTFLKVV